MKEKNINIEQKEEMVLVYNDMLEPLGFSERGVANLNGLWHFCSQCWIIHPNKNSRGSIVYQKRSLNKSVAPGLLDVSASGHVTGNNNTIDTAITEANEELGVKIKKSDLIYAGKRIDMFKHNEVLSRIFADVYFTIQNNNLSDYRIYSKELSGLLEIPIDEGIKLFTNKKSMIKCQTLMSDISDQKMVINKTEVTKDMFIHRYDLYYLKVFLMAEKLLLGDKIIAI